MGQVTSGHSVPQNTSAAAAVPRAAACTHMQMEALTMLADMLRDLPALDAVHKQYSQGVAVCSTKTFGSFSHSNFWAGRQCWGLAHITTILFSVTVLSCVAAAAAAAVMWSCDNSRAIASCQVGWSQVMIA